MTYSESGEDDALLRILGDEVGFAVDVGASDGRTINNTLLLEERGWTVLCVEPNPDHHDTLNACRKHVAPVAGSDHNGTVILYRYHRCGHSLSTVGPLGRQMQDRYARDARERDQIEVPCATVDSLLEQFGFPRCDLLCIDVDGHEAAVLRGFDFARWRPRAVLIEDVGIDPDLAVQLRAVGYAPDSRLWKLSGFNDLWTPVS